LSIKNSNSAEKVKKAASRCVSGYRGPIAPVSMCLALWLTGCAAPPVKVVTLPPVLLPEALLAACTAPLPPETLTFEANVEYSLKLLAVIKQCNAAKAAARPAEHYRQEQTHD